MKTEIKIRLTGRDKEFYKQRLEEFADLFDENKIEEVFYGKQDIRGAVGIVVYDKSYYEVIDVKFNNKWELLGFVCGFLANTKKYQKYTKFEKYLKEV